jgi:hypothetical protein
LKNRLAKISIGQDPSALNRLATTLSHDSAQAARVVAVERLAAELRLGELLLVELLLVERRLVERRLVERLLVERRIAWPGGGHCRRSMARTDFAASATRRVFR